MTPAPAGSEPGGFEMGPEIYLLILGVIATIAMLAVVVWLMRNMIREDREAEAARKARIGEDDEGGQR